MGDEPTEDKTEPSLELPSLRLPGLGRRRTGEQRRLEPGSAPVDAAPVAPVDAAPAAEPVDAPAAPVEVGPAGVGWSELPARVAVILTGLVVGLLGTALSYLSLRGCEAVKGTELCGRAGGFLLLLILALMVLVGAILLRLWQLPEPTGTSFLAVGVLCVVVLVTLIEELFSAWMFLVVPLLTAAAYVLARWVTTRFVEPVEPGPGHDVR